MGMRYIAVWTGVGAMPRTPVHRIESQNAVRLIGSNARGYIIEGDTDYVKALMMGLGDFKLEPCYPAGT